MKDVVMIKLDGTCLGTESRSGGGGDPFGILVGQGIDGSEYRAYQLKRQNSTNLSFK